MTSSENCKLACETTANCKASEYSSTRTCYLYASTADDSTVNYFMPGIEYSEKGACPDGKFFPSCS